MQLTPGDTIRLLETTITKGQYIGEEGTGYHFLAPGAEPRTGDISTITCGYYQGSDAIAEATVLRHCELLETQVPGEWCLFRMGDDRGLRPREAAWAGFLALPDGTEVEPVMAHDYRPTEAEYAAACKALGFDPSVHFVELTDTGLVGFTSGHTWEVAELAHAVERLGYRPAKSLLDAMARRGGQ